jgi:hypothetical protein
MTGRVMRLVLRCVGLAWLFVALVALWPARALGQSAVQARFFDEAARSAYARGDYEAALADFFALARIAPSQGTLYNVAICAELTHRDALAYDALDRYLAGPPDDATRMADARARLRAMSARLALVHVTSSHPGATIWVDRRELGAAGTAPDTLVLTPGLHLVELTHPAAFDARAEVVAENGVTREVHLDMVPRTGRLRVSVPGVEGAEIDALSEGSGAHHACVVDAETALPIGTYRVTVRAPGRSEESFVAQVREDAVESRVATLRALPRPTGTIVIHADFPGRVHVDGVERAETPARLQAIEVGTHRVEVVATGRRPWSADVEVEEGRVRYVNVSLVPE